jgi:hypothetical protein
MKNVKRSRRGDVVRRAAQSALSHFDQLESRVLFSTFTVDDNGPANFTTIQAAVNAAAANGTGTLDIINVAPGTYN